MMEMPECPMCGKPITIDREEPGIGRILFITGCKDCGLILPSWATPFVFFNEEEQRNRFLVENWEAVCRMSPHINSAKAENVLRTAYGMPQVSYLDFIKRDKFRRMRE